MMKENETYNNNNNHNGYYYDQCDGDVWSIEDESEDEMRNNQCFDEMLEEQDSKRRQTNRCKEFIHPTIEINVRVKLSSKEKRRERNKVQAKKSRERKKSELEGLKAQLAELTKENEFLKYEMNSIEIPPVDAYTLLMNDIQLPDDIANLIKQMMCISDNTAAQQEMKKSSFCIVNAISADLPIVYASPGFVELTGYETTEILGRNCRFLQGPKTDMNEVEKMKVAIAEGKDVSVVLLNYRKDGETFWNRIQLAHLKDKSGKTFLIVGIQTQLSHFEPKMNKFNRQQIIIDDFSSGDESQFCILKLSNRLFAVTVQLRRNLMYTQTKKPIVIMSMGRKTP